MPTHQQDDEGGDEAEEGAAVAVHRAHRLVNLEPRVAVNQLQRALKHMSQSVTMTCDVLYIKTRAQNFLLVTNQIHDTQQSDVTKKSQDKATFFDDHFSVLLPLKRRKRNGKPNNKTTQKDVRTEWSEP